MAVVGRKIGNGPGVNRKASRHRQQLGNVREGWRTLGRTAKHHGRLENSAEVWEAPAMIGKLQG